ncbi:MAG: ComF family protein [Ruminococcus sp.]|jgi:ComF family protein
MKWKEWILCCIYPRRCPVCDGIIRPEEGEVCSTCWEKIRDAEGFHCKKCGKFIEDGDREFCQDCENRRKRFDEGYGIFPYAGWVQESMSRFKFHGRVEYGRFYGKIMAAQAADRIERWKVQVILPVPMHRKKEKRRGYNQAEILAREVGKTLGIPVRKDLVFRTRNTKPLKEMTPEMRRKNLRDAFRAVPECGRYKSILLVDDIYTTGSTIDAIAKILKQQGTEKIYFLTACTGTGF